MKTNKQTKNVFFVHQIFISEIQPNVFISTIFLMLDSSRYGSLFVVRIQISEMREEEKLNLEMKVENERNFSRIFFSTIIALHWRCAISSNKFIWLCLRGQSYKSDNKVKLHKIWLFCDKLDYFPVGKILTSVINVLV